MLMSNDGRCAAALQIDAAAGAHTSRHCAAAHRPAAASQVAPLAPTAVSPRWPQSDLVALAVLERREKLLRILFGTKLSGHTWFFLAHLEAFPVRSRKRVENKHTGRAPDGQPIRYCVSTCRRDMSKENNPAGGTRQNERQRDGYPTENATTQGNPSMSSSQFAAHITDDVGQTTGVVLRRCQ